MQATYRLGGDKGQYEIVTVDIRCDKRTIDWAYRQARTYFVGSQKKEDRSIPSNYVYKNEYTNTLTLTLTGKRIPELYRQAERFQRKIDKRRYRPAKTLRFHNRMDSTYVLKLLKKLVEDEIESWKDIYISRACVKPFKDKVVITLKGDITEEALNRIDFTALAINHNLRFTQTLKYVSSFLCVIELTNIETTHDKSELQVMISECNRLMSTVYKNELADHKEEQEAITKFVDYLKNKSLVIDDENIDERKSTFTFPS